MKKILLGITIIMSLLFAGCNSKTPENPKLTEMVAAEINGLTISVKPELELLSIIQYMGKNNMNIRYGLVSKFYTDYKKQIDDYFRKYDTHEAVKFYEEMTGTEKDSIFDEPIMFILCMNPDFTVNLDAYKNYENTYGSYFQSPEKLQEFFDLLKDYCSVTNFNQFFKDHISYYNTIIANTVTKLPENDLIEQMEDFYGHSADSYNVVLVTLFHTGGFGPSVEVNGKNTCYSVIGPDSVNNRIPDFRDTEFFTELEAHELGHSFIPIANEKDSPFAELITQSEYLFKPIAADMEQNAYEKWDTALEELILRACVVKIMENYYPEQTQKLLKDEREIGFIYIDTVYQSLDKYVKNRTKYKEFDLFIPVIIEDLMGYYQ